MNFTFHQLKIFLEVIRHQNITKAAEEMYMTQPALSIQLKNFQKQFDIPLVEKVGKKIQLTDFGKSIAQIAKNILNEAEELKYKTKEYEGLLTGKLRISSASTGKYVIPYYLSGFVHEFPGIDLTLDVSNRTTVIKQLQNNEIDFALVSVLPEKLDTDEEVLLENKLYLIGDTEKIIKSRPLIYREQGSATRNAMSMYFHKSTKRKSIELTSNEAVKQAVVAGLGYSIIPLIGMSNELKNKDIYIIPSKGLPILTYWRLIWLKNKKLSPVASAYLDFIRKEKEAIIKKHFGWYVDF
ncbi:LysR substrate-binding domain-containing protein [Flavobacteriales bacterium]|nr:LysR substrate-binding domain-containing protein [Flavobacteriales bacterium]